MDLRDALIHILTEELTEKQALLADVLHEPQWEISAPSITMLEKIRIQIHHKQAGRHGLTRLEVGWVAPSECAVRDIDSHRTEIFLKSERALTLLPSVPSVRGICYSHRYGIYVQYDSGLRLRDAILNNFECA